MVNLIMGFRESFEAVLVVLVMLKIINDLEQKHLKKYLFLGVIGGIITSIVAGITINNIYNFADTKAEFIQKLWESSVSALAAILVLTLVYYMIKNKENIANNIKDKTKKSLYPLNIFFLALFMISREGFEIILFIFANPNADNIIPLVTLGILGGVSIGIALYYSIIKVNITKIFNITLIYLILQVGYLVGYSVHEFIEVLEIKAVFLDSTFLYSRLYDLSGTILDQKSSILGIGLNSFLGWTSKPHILQFISQYAVTFYLLYIYKKNKLTK